MQARYEVGIISCPYQVGDSLKLILLQVIPIELVQINVRTNINLYIQVLAKHLPNINQNSLSFHMKIGLHP